MTPGSQGLAFRVRTTVLITSAALLIQCGWSETPGGRAPNSDLAAALQGAGHNWGPSDGDMTDPTAVHVATWTHHHFQQPLRIATDSRGWAYVTDSSADAIHVLTPTGRYHRAIRVRDPLGIAVDANDRLVFSDRRGRVLRINPDGTPLALLSRLGETAKPLDVAVDHGTGWTYVLDSPSSQVVVFGADDQPVATFGTPGAGDTELGGPTEIEVDSVAGEVYVSDSANHRVQVFDRTGLHLRTLDGASQLSRTQGIALGPGNRVYVADIFQGRVAVLGKNGGYAPSFIGTYGVKPGNLRLPGGVDLDVFGRLLVVSTGTRTVEVFGIDDFTTPHDSLPATVKLQRGLLLDPDRSARAHMYIDVPDSNATIVPESVRVAGTVSIYRNRLLARNVVHHEEEWEAQVSFSPWELPPVYKLPGSYLIPVTGTLRDGNDFEGSFRVQIIHTDLSP